MSGAKVDLSGGAQSSSAPTGFGGGGPGTAPSSGYGGGGGFAQQAAEAALQDPTVQQQLKEAAYTKAQEGLEAARVAGAMAAEELGKYIEEGPAGISVLCFLGGLATTIIGILGLLNFGYGLTSPFAYVLNAYLVAFGIVTFLLEADVESMRKLKFIGRFSPWVEGYQMEVFNRANFLTELRGRGFFYLFIGTLAVTQCFVCLTFVAGLWNMLMGILCLLMSFGINPASHLQGAQAPLTAGP
mmetsp:Transcript_3340/g.7821  ORF Transcript_3340/g.7821 Transcript_3340/m.7821 type:complete len:242 (-) Transcript_3340:31-756(-)|eukprot:CAMPEP_0181445016 /NCGR_PEP_ID=MMETSP1110-20121109/25372_1 /TAXON_ID=174948 /ORGANISM="Symbiodinium sp., Strain CCMP421" /LENGTH=241 /DNA_ID=CAMNT_0023569051 /DNA_START=68 /DNA_END=793 /DNA_ORIENTATION=+